MIEFFRDWNSTGFIAFTFDKYVIQFNSLFFLFVEIFSKILECYFEFAVQFVSEGCFP